MIHRGFRFRLYPTDEQQAAFRHFSGVCRLVYNLALEQRRDWNKQYVAATGRPLNFCQQSSELTQLRVEFDFIAAVTRTCLQESLRDLDTAFRKFFSGRARYPTPRKKGVDDRFRFMGREIGLRSLNAKWGCVRLPKIGWIKFRQSRALRGEIKTVTISYDALGWHVSFGCAIEHEPPTNICPSVGIDRGVAQTLTFSTGESLSIPASLETIDRRYRNAQRTLSRRKRGSKRRLKALRRVASISARRARVRLDWQHKASAGIVGRFGTVVLEDLKVKRMTARRRVSTAES
jgi:putative transposase